MMAVLEKNTSPLARATSDYWRSSRRPLASLLFILPLLLVYEGGILWLGAEAVRNGADVWMQQLLGYVGIGGFLLMPLLTIGILLAWHYTTRESWRVGAGVLYSMAAECAVLAIALVMIAHLHAHLLSVAGVPMPSGMSLACDLQPSAAVRWFFTELVRYFGAGIYEEMMFRLILLPVIIGAMALMGVSWKAQVIVGVVFTSLIFSAAHHVGPHGESLVTYVFVFRAVAGMIFGLLFVFRGFGIAAGTHALYDIFVAMPSA